MSVLAVRILTGLGATSSAVGAGFGVSQLYSPNLSKKDIQNAKERLSTFAEVREWLKLDGDEERWKEKVNLYKEKGNSDPSLDGYESGTDESKNIENMKKACGELLDSSFNKRVFDQVERWCSIKKKVHEMFGKKRMTKLVSSDVNVKAAIEEYKKRENAPFWFDGLRFTGSTSDTDIQAFTKKCEDIKNSEVDDNKNNALLFERWCISKNLS